MGLQVTYHYIIIDTLTVLIPFVGNGKTISLKAIMKTVQEKGFNPLYVKSFISKTGTVYSSVHRLTCPPFPQVGEAKKAQWTRSSAKREF